MAHHAADAPLIASTGQVAAMLCMSTRRVQQLREEGMPRAGHGKWNLMAVIPWYLEHIEKTTNPRDKTSEEAQRRYYLARAGLTEHKEAEAKGQALSVAEHKAVIAELCADLAGTIESFPVREYTAPDDRERAQRVCHRLRERLAESVSSSGLGSGARDREPSTGAAAGEERKPVGGSESDVTAA